LPPSCSDDGSNDRPHSSSGQWRDVTGCSRITRAGAHVARSIVYCDISCHNLHGDDVIILYSEGLVERRGESLDVGIDQR